MSEIHINPVTTYRGFSQIRQRAAQQAEVLWLPACCSFPTQPMATDPIWLSYLLIALIVGVSAFTQAVVGVGVILIAMPLATLLLDVRLAVPLINLLALTLNLYLIWHLRANLRAEQLVPMLLAAIPGVALGTWLLLVLPASVLEFILGVMLLGYGIYSLLAHKGAAQQELGKFWTYSTGLVGGILGGAIAVSGPPLILYVTHQPWPKDRIKATMIGFFTGSCLLIASAHFANGLVTPTVWSYYLTTLPTLVLGMLVGLRVYRHVSEERYRTLLKWVVLLLGVVLLGKVLPAWL